MTENWKQKLIDAHNERELRFKKKKSEKEEKAYKKKVEIEMEERTLLVEFLGKFKIPTPDGKEWWKDGNIFCSQGYAFRGVFETIGGRFGATMSSGEPYQQMKSLVIYADTEGEDIRKGTGRILKLDSSNFQADFGTALSSIDEALPWLIEEQRLKVEEEENRKFRDIVMNTIVEATRKIRGDSFEEYVDDVLIIEGYPYNIPTIYAAGERVFWREVNGQIAYRPGLWEEYLLKLAARCEQHDKEHSIVISVTGEELELKNSPIEIEIDDIDAKIESVIENRITVIPLKEEPVVEKEKMLHEKMGELIEELVQDEVAGYMENY